MICKTCGAEFAPKSNHAQMFCCHSCANLAANRKYQERKREMEGVVLGDSICPICGKTFRQKRRIQKYCSKDCQRKNGYKAIYAKRMEARRKKRIENTRASIVKARKSVSKPKSITIVQKDIRARLTDEALREQVLRDLTLPAEKRWIASRKWTKAQHRYTARIWNEMKCRTRQWFLNN